MVNMNIPGNGIYVVQGEMNILLAAMRRGTRWSSHNHQDEENDILLRSFAELKDILNHVGDLRELEPNHFLGPFLEVIRSEDTTGPVTSLALSSINKFLSYGLIDPNCMSIAITVENIANAVNHARFVGTDQASDAVVLFKILQVLKTLMLSPGGSMLTNDSVCDIMLSCFRICFENRLSELLRRCAENCVKDLVQLLFTRLPTFSDDQKKLFIIKKLKMRAGSIDSGKTTKRKSRPTKLKEKKPEEKQQQHQVDVNLKRGEGGKILDMQGMIHQAPELQSPVSEYTPLISSEALTSSVEAASPTLEAKSAIVEVKSPAVETPPPVVEELITPVTEEAVVPKVELTAAIPEPAAPVTEPCVPEETSHMEQDLSEQKSPEIATSKDSSNLGASLEEEHKTELREDVEGVVIRIEDSDTQSVDIILQPTESEVDASEFKEVVEEMKQVMETREVVEEAVVPVSQTDTSLCSVETQSTALQVPEKLNESGTMASLETQDWVNQQGVRFTAEEQETEALGKSLAPYGLVSVQELLRFLVSLCNPFDKENTDAMQQMGLALITVALEVGADSIAKFPSLLALVKDELCRNLFALLQSERLSIFAADLQVAFLLFESLRTHLKFQFERFLSRLTEIIVSDSSKITHEQKEIALETVVQLWRIPGLVTELYLNYDCDLYCPNLYEELTKLLSKNAFPIQGVYNIHLLSVDALLTVIDAIEAHCHSRILNERQQTVPDVNGMKENEKEVVVDSTQKYIVRSGSRQKVSVNIPSHEQLMAIKRKKKLLATGTEHFNTKPKKGIQFLQEHHLLSTPLDSQEVVHFLRENPHLEKKMIGEYISNRANLSVLEHFVNSFDFTDTRIDEALRLYLESFRLPGESPLISLLMEHFADHWHKCNGEPFVNADAAFTLAYAVIMLNVDQHNHNVKKQNNPMKPEDFKRNLKNVNGGLDFDQDMLDDIYTSIQTEEIVMPAEQTGLVRENYLWKVLLRRGAGRDGIYIHAPSGLLDHDLFSLIWSPTVAALSFLFDKTNDKAIYLKAINGFRKCAMISAHYGMSSDFDNLIVSLCKFTMLHNSPESPDNLTISFGANPKAMLAAKTVFHLAHRHGDIVRESWRNILDIILQLYKCKLLPKILVEAEDFIELSGKIALMREEIQLNQKPETGILSSLYSYIALAAETNTQKGPSPEDQEAIRLAQNCIRECQLEQLITESKFLRIDSLHHFVKALIRASYGPEGHVSLGSAYSEDTAVFFLEFLLKVVIQNRDRVGSMWSSVREHIYTLLMGAAACDHHFLVERSVVGLLRLAIRLMRREEMSPIVLQSLRMLLLLKGSTLSRVARQVSYGMYELLKTSAANIHSATDWAIIFTLLECVGAGAPPPRVVGKPSHINESGARSEGEAVVDSGLGNERGYTSDSELSKAGSQPLSPTSSPDLPLNTPTGWILVGREGEIQPVSLGNRVPPPDTSMTDRELSAHDPFAMVKCCESLAFLVRDVAHITPFNFENCVHCIRTFVEASAEANDRRQSRKAKEVIRGYRKRVTAVRKREDRARSPTSSPYDADESDPEEVPSGYQQVCIQLLDLMHTLHTRTAQIYRWWAEESSETEHVSLWIHGWCPLLQGISRLCSHSNRQVRMSAITYLQRALLVHDLQTLTGAEWESCFTQVLFPLLGRLLEPITSHHDGLEETRIRAATVLSKVFLHHLTPLLSLNSFTQLWLTILDFMDKYMHADNSDLLYEAIPESLKNMLLVMDSASVFMGCEGYNEIWTVTWDRINMFLPNLRSELFRAHPAEMKESNEEFRVESPLIPEGKTSPPPPLSVSPPHAVSSLVPPAREDNVETSPVAQSILTANMPTLVTPQNWQPPAPIFPHMGQLLSTPIGPPVNPSAPVPLPMYSGFANTTLKSEVPSAQFFYQDLPQNVPSHQIQVQQSSGVNLLLATDNPTMPKLPVISPPQEPPS